MANKSTKAAASKTAASNKETAEPKQATTFDVTNAQENPEFSKVKGNTEATDLRVSQTGPSEQIGPSKQTPDADAAAKVQRKEAAAAEKNPEGLEFTFEKQKYKFVDHAPQTIRVSGQKLTQKEIAANQEILLELIGGNSSLLKKL